MKIKTLQLKSLAFEKGYTFTDLAKVAGVSRNTVSCVFNGKNCSLATAGKLAKALNVPLSEIAEE